jgi:hypothetical protein
MVFCQVCHKDKQNNADRPTAAGIFFNSFSEHPSPFLTAPLPCPGEGKGAAGRKVEMSELMFFIIPFGLRMKYYCYL